MTGLGSSRRNSVSAKYLSEAKLKKLLEYVSDKAQSARRRGTTRAIIDELIIVFIVDTGLRPGEFCALNIEDLPVSHGRKTLLVRDSTGAVAREVEISTKATELIARFTALYRVDAKPQDPFLASERGNRFTYRSLYNKIRKIGIEAGIGPFHPHMLRSTFIVNRFNETQDLRLVQKEVGHASAKTTALYTQKNHNVRCDACDSLLGGQERKIESGQILCKNCLKYFQ